MNDRFKFRVWIINHATYATADQISDILSEYAYISCFDNDIKHGCYGYESGGNTYIELEQCTGLKDKNGKLIYEGDIVKFGWSIWVVNWNEDESCWYASDYDMLCAVGTSDDEVIGNIHENGDLLK